MKVALKEAEEKLAELIAEAAGGKEVLITREDGITVQIVLRQVSETKKRRGAYGSLKGQIWMADDFDAPLEDLEREIYDT